MPVKLIDTDSDYKFFGKTDIVLINTVNCVGTMDKGLALEFKNRYPILNVKYSYLCNKGLIYPGSITPIVIEESIFIGGTNRRMTHNNIILLFATKDHWKNPSKLTYIFEGLNTLRQLLMASKVKLTIHMPALGCSNGGLDWNTVSQMIYDALNFLDHDIYLFEPGAGF